MSRLFDEAPSKRDHAKIMDLSGLQEGCQRGLIVGKATSVLGIVGRSVERYALQIIFELRITRETAGGDSGWNRLMWTE